MKTAKVLSDFDKSAYDYQQLLNDSYKYCQQIAKKQSNYFLGMSSISERKKQALYAVYAWFRAVDDIADDETQTKADRLTKLQDFHLLTKKMLDERSFNLKDFEDKEKYWLAFRDTVHYFHIPPIFFYQMIEGQKKDLNKFVYHDFTELYDYCYSVASTVGFVCIYIWGFTYNEKIKQLTEASGIAMQLTNILRDLKKDIALQHIYIPSEFFGREITADNFNSLPQAQVQKAIDKLISKNEEYYKEAENLKKYILPDSRLSFVVMFNTYRAIFEMIKKNRQSLLSEKQIKLGKLQFLIILIKSHFQNQIDIGYLRWMKKLKQLI